MTSVMVPWSMPVGTLLMPAALARRITSSGSAVVAMSMSPGARSSSALRTAPPTTRASSPSALSSSRTRAVPPAINQGASASNGSALIIRPLFLRARHELAVHDMGGNVGRIRRGAGEMREPDQPRDHQDERDQDEARDDRDRPGRTREQSGPGGREEQRIDGKGDEEDSDLGQNRPDHDE